MERLQPNRQVKMSTVLVCATMCWAVEMACQVHVLLKTMMTSNSSSWKSFWNILRPVSLVCIYTWAEFRCTFPKGFHFIAVSASAGPEADSARSCVSACRLTSYFQQHPFARRNLIKATYVHSMWGAWPTLTWLRPVHDADADCILERPCELVPEPPPTYSEIWIVVECGGEQCFVPLPLSEQDYTGAVASPFPVQLAANGLCQDRWGLVDERFHGRSRWPWKSSCQFLAIVPCCWSEPCSVHHASLKAWFSPATHVPWRWRQRTLEESCAGHEFRFCSSSFRPPVSFTPFVHSVSWWTLCNWRRWSRDFGSTPCCSGKRFERASRTWLGSASLNLLYMALVNICIYMHAWLHEVEKKDGSKKTMFVGMVGVRGDWPWQRLSPRCIHKKNAVCLLLPWAQALRKMPPVVHRVHIGPGMPLMQWWGRLNSCALHVVNSYTPCMSNPFELQEWWRADAQARWRANRPGADPTYRRSAMSSVPGCGPLVCPDQAHTWHLGLGQELCASIIALGQACFVFMFLRRSCLACAKLHVAHAVIQPGIAGLQIQSLGWQQHPWPLGGCVCWFWRMATENANLKQHHRVWFEKVFQVPVAAWKHAW